MERIQDRIGGVGDGVHRRVRAMLAVLLAMAALPLSAVATAAPAGAQTAPSPLALYEFSEGSGTTVADTSGVGAPLDLTIADPGAVSWTPGGLDVTGSTTIASAGAASKVTDAVVASGEFTVEAWIQPANTTQGGPARVVNIGQDSLTRNVMLGQGAWGSRPDDVFTGRVRSTGAASDANGNPTFFTPAGTATTTLTHVVLTRDAAGVQTLYVNGVAQNSVTVPGDTSNWTSSYPLTLANEADGSRPWNGTFCRVAIYDAALSATEVADNEAAGCDAVPPVNTPPVLDPIGDQLSAPGATVALAVSASDADDDVLTFGATGLPASLDIDANTGVISGAVDAGAAAGSPYSVTVTVSDAEDTDVETFTWTVEANDPPVVDAIADQSNDEGDPVNLAVTATDPETGPLTYDATGLPGGLSIDPGTGVISGTIAQDAAAGSIYAVTVSVTDDADNTVDETFDWTVNAVNVAPTIDPVTDQDDDEGDAVSVTVTGDDVDGDALTYGASGLPAGLSINPTTGEISGTIDAGAEAGSPYTVTVSVDDGTAAPVETTFTWTVGTAPPIAAGAIVLYEFLEGSGTTVADTSGVGAPLDLTIADPGAVNWTAGGLDVTGSTTIQSPGAASKITDAVVASGEVTIEAWLDPDNTTQGGPARVVNVGADPLNRNIMLGQGAFGSNPDDVFTARLRSTGGDNNGNPTFFTPAGTATTNLTHVVLTRDAAGVQTLYVNGVAENSLTVLGDTSNWTGAFPLTLANEADGSRPWNGTFCRVAIYDTALSATDVADANALGCERDVDADASFTITVNTGSEALASGSTFGGDSIAITNTSSFGLELDQVSIDLSTALYPDVLFDPNGTAGDALAKCLEPNAASAALVGLSTATDPCFDPFTGGRDGGFEVMTIDASDWQPGETLLLSVDIDPTSIQGVPGAGNSGAVAGFELSGSTVTATFSDATVLVDDLFVQPSADADNGINDAAGQLVSPNLGVGPVIDVPSVTLDPTVFTNGATAGVTDQAGVDVEITGTPNADVVLYVTESGLDVDPGFDVDPFEANKAEDIVAYPVTLDGTGSATVTIALSDLVQEPLVAAPVDLYYLMAGYADGTGAVSDPSNFVYLQKVASTNPSVAVTINGGSDSITASTFGNGSFSVTNTSPAGVQLTSISIDLSTGVFPDVVFDPVGAAGDATAKCLTVSAGGAAVGFVAPTDPCVDPFSGPRDNGFDVLTIDATDWDSGETLTFAVDIDPTSIQAVAGAGNSGSVSGFELIGSTITTELLVGATPTTLDGSLFVQPSTDANGVFDGAGTLQLDNLGAAPLVDVPALPLAPTGFPNGAVAAQTALDTVDVVITGTPNADVLLVAIESTKDVDPGFDPDPFEANTAEAIATYAVTLDGTGEATVAVALPDAVQSTIVPDPVDLYYLVAAYDGAGTLFSDTSVPVYLEKVEATAPSIDPIANLTVIAGDNAAFAVSSTDPDLDPITLDIASTPDVEALGAVFTDNTDGTGSFSWDTEASDTGLYTVTVSATAGGETTTQDVTINVLPSDADALFRVNVGGPQIAAADASSPDWSEDSAATPSIYLVDTAGTGVFATTNTIDTSDASVPAQAPAALFQTERFDNPDPGAMEWAFPASSGNNYLINLYFAETFTTGTNPIDTVGERVFDVTLEGVTVIDDLDVFAEVGADAGIMRSFQLSLTDDIIDIGFVPGVQNPALKGIEIIDLGTSTIPATGNITVTPDPLALDDTAPQGTVTIANDAAPGTPAIEVTSLAIGGADVGVFDVSTTGPVFVAPGGSTDVTVTYSGTATGPFTASLDVTHQGVNASPQSIVLTGTGDTSPTTGTVFARINAGGPLVASLDAGPDWEADTTAANHPFLSAAGSDDNAGFAANDPGPTVPATVPGVVFDTERWSTSGFAYSVPVPAGTQVYVNVYAGNGFGGTSAVGDRVFDIAIDGVVVENDLDLVDTFGHQVGGQLQYLVVSDGVVDVSFANVVENPLVNALEVVVAESQPGVLAASPTAVDFGVVAVGSTPSATISLDNLGFETGDPAITISDVTVSGGEFSTDASTPIVLGTNGSDSFQVTFSPTSATAQAETLTITHDGVNSPILIDLSGVATTNVPISFSKSNLVGESSNNPTSLDWGPDGRLYVSQQNGNIYAYTVSRDGAAPGSGTFSVTDTELITLVKDLPNHNDDGTLNTGQTNRQITGLTAEGTATNPVLYVSSSDPRIGAGGSGNDVNLDTNSGVISRLTWNGTSWDLLNLVQGLPRSEENHSTNGLQLSDDGTTLYVQSGGHTNQGGKSNNFAFTPEYALSASILTVDLAAIGENTYNLPTLQTAGAVAPGNIVGNPDPFGGQDGANMAIWDVAGPVDVFSTGWRNGYDLVLTVDGFLFATDNGPNGGWGGPPTGEGVNNTCTDVEVGTGNTQNDQLHYVPFGYHAGHANPTQGNPTIFPGAVRGTTPFSLDQACDYVPAGTNGSPGPGGGLAVISGSTNGITEYTASNFGGAMQGDLLMTTFGSSVYRAKRDGAGTGLVDLGDASVNGPEELFFSGLGGPLDIIASGDSDPFPGVIVVAEFGSDNLVFFEPNDFGVSCTGVDDPAIDEDADGYTNADEIDNGTDPCNGGDTPPDQDGDLVSDLNDNDDDNDGITDDVDTFALDPANGLDTDAPLLYTFEQSSVPNAPVIFNGLGFTGVMTNGQDWESNWDGSDNVKLGGAASILTIVDTPPGDAFEGNNSQLNALQFGVDPTSLTGETTVRSLILEPFPAGFTPTNFQSAGIFIGPGDQDNYLKLVVNAGGGTGGVQMGIEQAGTFTSIANPSVPTVVGSAQNTELQLVFDPVTGSVEGFYDTGAGLTSVGTTTIPADWLDGPEALAVGVISTSFNSGSFGTVNPFAVGWEEIEILVDSGPVNGAPTITSASSTTVAEGDPLSFTVTATDPETDPITYSIGGEPAGMTIDPVSGAIQWTPDLDDSGSYVVTVGADDGNNPVVTADLTIDVTQTDAGEATYRINVGGPAQTALDPPAIDWAVDTAGAPSAFRIGGSNNTYSTAAGSAYALAPVTDPSVPASTPAAAFETERFDTGGAPFMAWDFPVVGGSEVEVRLGFAELFSGITAAGEREFGVEIDGVLVETGIDPFAEAGAGGALVRDYLVTADGDGLDIVLVTEVENPALKSIEIRTLTTPTNLPPTITSATSTTVAEGDSLSFFVTATDPETDPITYSIGGEPAGMAIDPVTGEITWDTDFDDSGSYDIAVGANDGTTLVAGSLTIDVTQTDAGTVLYRVNAGGPAVTDPNGDWDVDTNASPSIFRTAANFATTTDTIDLSDPTVPAGTPEAIIQSERWSNHTWAFPVVAGSEVEVRLYAAEIFNGVSSRIYDLSVDGVLVADDLDLLTTYGPDGAVVIDTVITSDGTVDIEVGPASADNPKINAIEIREITPAPPSGLGAVIERINAGGPTVTAIDGEQDWEADTDTANHPALTAAGSNDTGGFTFGGSDPSVPGYLPTTVYSTERYSTSGFTWEIPVSVGQTVDLRLFMMNGWPGTSAPGSRLFDVTIEGVLELDEFDLSATYGHQVGGMEQFTVTDDGDGVITIVYSPGAIENPLVNAIEVREVVVP
ncbi:MAG: malectin domain-containing carbohydrate-binding protein [Actinomycetota bacterium]